MTKPVLVFGHGHRVGASSNDASLIDLPTDLLRSAHIIGKAGYGKSYLIAALVLQLIHQGIGCTVIDPAGDLVDLILAKLVEMGFYTSVRDAFSRVLYVDIPGALKHNRYLPFNILKTGYDPHTTSDLVLEAFKRAWPQLQSGTATNIELLVKMSAYVLASQGMSLLPHMYTLLTDASFRVRMLAGIHYPLVVQFFRQFGEGRNGQLQITSDPTLKRLFLLMFAPVLRHSLGQSENALDFRQTLECNRTVLIKLNLADQSSLRLLGCLYTVFAEIGAKSRGELAPEARSRHILVLDEFQNFTAQSGKALSHILEECRKFGLFLGLAHQNWVQVPPELSGALNQCGIAAAFHLERSDAEITAPSLGFPFDPYLRKPTVFNLLSRTIPSPQFYSRSEQREMSVDAIAKLGIQEAFIRFPTQTFTNQLYKLRTLDVTKPRVDKNVLAHIQAQYSNKYFRPAPTYDKNEDVTIEEESDKSPMKPNHATPEPSAKDESDYDLF